MLEPYSVPLVDCSGRVRRIRSLPLADRRWFLEMRLALQEKFEQEDFRVLYDCDQTFKALVDECLQLHGLSPAWVDAYIATRLLFGLGDEPAILMQLNFPPEPEPTKDAKPLPPGIDPEAYQVASLWGATDSLEQALKAAREQPWQEVKAVLNARGHQIKMMDKEVQAKEKEDERLDHSREVMENLKESGKLGELLNAITRNGSNAPKLEQLPDDYLP